MSRLAFIPILAGLFILSGCGGGGGGAPANPAAEVQSQIRALGAAWESEDVDRILSFYDPSYNGPGDETRDSLAESIPPFLSRVQVLGTSEQMANPVVTNNGATVTISGGYLLTVRDDLTGEEATFGTDAIDTWEKKQVGWRLTASSGSAFRVANH